MVLFGGIMRRREVAAESRGRSEGIAEGRSQGIVEGIAQGSAQTNEKWQEWNRRRLEADAAGRSFTEPPPSGLPSESKTDT